MTSIHRLVSLAFLILLWGILSAIFPATIIPDPLVVSQAMWENIWTGEALFHLSKTFLRVSLGLVLALVLGTAIGLVMGLSKKGELFFDSWVLVGLTLPAIVYGMVCLLWFGLNDAAAIVAIGLTAFPAVAINMWQGVKAVDRDLLVMGRSLRLNRRKLILKIVFPQLVPYTLAAARYALGICWKICTTVELIGMSSGVGFMLNYWFGLFSMTQVFAWTMLFLMVMFVIEFGFFKPVERHLTRWRSPVSIAQTW